MKVLIIKNDGFGDLILSLPVLNGIHLKNHNNLQIDIVLSKRCLSLKNYLKNFNNIFFLEKLGPGFNLSKKISENDRNILKKIKSINYDKCFVMRRKLDYEQLQIMKIVKAKKKYICAENYPKNLELFKKLKEQTKNWIDIKINKKFINEYEYFSEFLKKVGFNLNINKKLFLNNQNKALNNKIVLNLSGEKQISVESNFKILLDMLLLNTSRKIIVIGITYEKKLRKKINTILNKYKHDKRIENHFLKTDFKKSMDIIDKSNTYIGFDTGLSHYAVWKNINSLIILSSGGGYKWFPYPKKIRKKESYWIYNTPCSDCGFVEENKCIFKKRYCVDNIFDNNFKVYFSAFLKKKISINNFSRYNNFYSNWRYRSSRSFIYSINKNGEIYLNKSFFSKIKYFNEIIKFIIFNNLTWFLFKKILTKLF